MANGSVSPGSKYVDWDIKYHQRQTKHFGIFYLTEECVRANMHYLYIDRAVKPELQTNINTSVNQIMQQSFTPLSPPPSSTYDPGIPYWKYGHKKLCTMYGDCPHSTMINYLGYINYICIIAEDHVSDYCGPVGEFKMYIIPIII